MINRLINLPKNQSFLLFGPRGTGKSTLVKSIYKEDERDYINLLEAETEESFARSPDLLRARVGALSDQKKFVIIDEIQKIPKLLDIVHLLIEEGIQKQFILTGSSARKLKRGGANLLAGRAIEKHVFPFTREELSENADTAMVTAIMHWGSLPKIFQITEDSEKKDFLQTYANVYLKEEIWGEQFIRKLDPFRKFLEVAAQSNGKIINFSNIARDCGVDDNTVKSYFEILEDTMVGFFLEPFSTSVRKRIYKSPKFYFFDIGVTRALARLLTVPPLPSTSYFGEVFEHLVVLEFVRREGYLRRDYRFSYLRTISAAEIDLIIERPGKPLACIEIKSTDRVTADTVKKLERFISDFPNGEFFCVTRDPIPKKFGQIHALPWFEAIKII